MDEVLFYMLLACSSIIAFDLIALDSSDTFSLETAVTLYDLSTILAMTFIHCYSSEQITQMLYNIGDIYYNSMWYHLPVALQKSIIFPIQRSSREFRLKSLGLIDCSLPAFLSVRRYDYSPHESPSNVDLFVSSPRVLIV